MRIFTDIGTELPKVGIIRFQNDRDFSAQLFLAVINFDILSDQRMRTAKEDLLYDLILGRILLKADWLTSRLYQLLVGLFHKSCVAGAGLHSDVQSGKIVQ